MISSQAVVIAFALLLHSSSARDFNIHWNLTDVNGIPVVLPQNNIPENGTLTTALCHDTAEKVRNCELRQMSLTDGPNRTCTITLTSPKEADRRLYNDMQIAPLPDERRLFVYVEGPVEGPVKGEEDVLMRLRVVDMATCKESEEVSIASMPVENPSGFLDMERLVGIYIFDDGFDLVYRHNSCYVGKGLSYNCSMGFCKSSFDLDGKRLSKAVAMLEKACEDQRTLDYLEDALGSHSTLRELVDKRYAMDTHISTFWPFQPPSTSSRSYVAYMNIRVVKMQLVSMNAKGEVDGGMLLKLLGTPRMSNNFGHGAVAYCYTPYQGGSSNASCTMFSAKLKVLQNVLLNFDKEGKIALLSAYILPGRELVVFSADEIPWERTPTRWELTRVDSDKVQWRLKLTDKLPMTERDFVNLDVRKEEDKYCVHISSELMKRNDMIKKGMAIDIGVRHHCFDKNDFVRIEAKVR